MAGSATLDWDDFYFSSMGLTEDIAHYTPGGYHPVVIGDILKSKLHRYRIMNKLGFGSNSTVWLAEQMDSNQSFLAIKIMRADHDLTKEVAMFEAASNIQGNGKQSSHILTVIDSFTLNGPNGTHSVLVTDVIVPIHLLLISSKCLSLWRKVAVQGIAQAVAKLHSAGIIHGDLHIEIIGTTIPELADQHPDDIMFDLEIPDPVVVLPISPSNQTPSLPAYVVASCSLEKYYEKITSWEFPQIKIFNVSSAHITGTLRHFQCTPEMCAPEFVYAQVVEQNSTPLVGPAVDVWTLGINIYYIVAGSSLFRVGMAGLQVLSDMAIMAGSLPPGWESWYAGLQNPPEVSSSSADTFWRSRREILRPNCRTEADCDALIALLRKVLVLDPTMRPTATEVLQNPWFPSDVATCGGASPTSGMAAGEV